MPPKRVPPMVPKDAVDVDNYELDTFNDERIAWLLNVELNQARDGAIAADEPITIVDSDDEDEKANLGFALVSYQPQDGFQGEPASGLASPEAVANVDAKNGVSEVADDGRGGGVDGVKGVGGVEAHAAADVDESQDDQV